MRCIFICLLCFCLCGCSYPAPPGEAHGSRVITSVEVTATENGQLHRYHYNTETKVRTILTYLRRIKPELAVSIDPDTFRTEQYCVTLHLSDGSQTVYRQLHTEYLQKNDGVWRSIDPAHGSALVRILKELPPDA